MSEGLDSQFTLRQADHARSDFAIIEDELEAIQCSTRAAADLG
jgi:hypothetical protein